MDRPKRAVKKILAAAGLDLRRLSSATPGATASYNLGFEIDETFKSIFRKGVKASGSTHDPEVVHQRLYNAVQFLGHTLDLDGEVAECGAFQGLSSYLFCSYLRLACPDFDGRGYHIFDSFQGLSQPPRSRSRLSGSRRRYPFRIQKGRRFHGSLEAVKSTLMDFPQIEYHRGWIPESFAGIPEKNYRFVHLDLDLYEPIKGSVEYFYPRMVKGGVIVIDEYAFPRWPGARKAVDEFCQLYHLVTPVALTTGNGVMIKNVTALNEQMKKLLRALLPKENNTSRWLDCAGRNLPQKDPLLWMKQMIEHQALSDTDLIELRNGIKVTGKMDYARHDIYLHVDSMTEYETRLHSCRKEPDTVQWIEDSMKPGDIFYDVGANVGAYSLVAAKCFAGAVKVYAFEPAFLNFSQLCRNIFLNNCQETVFPLSVALSDKTIIDEFNYHDLVTGGSLHTLGETIDHKGDSVHAGRHSKNVELPDLMI